MKIEIITGGRSSGKSMAERQYKQILEGNIKLQDENIMYKKDIYILINYIKGNKLLEIPVKEIINYYSLSEKKQKKFINERVKGSENE